jgi:hypothetical protein
VEWMLHGRPPRGDVLKTVTIRSRPLTTGVTAVLTVLEDRSSSLEKFRRT